MSKVQSPKNCYALAIYLLLENKKKGMTMREAVNEHFYKFQTRLLDVEKSISTKTGQPRASVLKIDRTRESKENRFGHTMSFVRYKANCSSEYLINLIAHLNENGLK